MYPFVLIRFLKKKSVSIFDLITLGLNGFANSISLVLYTTMCTVGNN